MILSPKIKQTFTTNLSVAEIQNKLSTLTEVQRFFNIQLIENTFSFRHKPKDIVKTPWIAVSGTIENTITERRISICYSHAHKNSFTKVLGGIGWLFFAFMAYFFFYEINTKSDPDIRLFMNLMLTGTIIVTLFGRYGLLYLFLWNYSAKLDDFFITLWQAKKCK
jgi:hypothetical protein